METSDGDGSERGSVMEEAKQSTTGIDASLTADARDKGESNNTVREAVRTTLLLAAVGVAASLWVSRMLDAWHEYFIPSTSRTKSSNDACISSNQTSTKSAHETSANLALRSPQ